MKTSIDKSDTKWLKPSLDALNWFIQIMGEDEWIERRQAVVNYFKSIDIVNLTKGNIQPNDIHKFYHPIAFYDDWMGWYMYLVESIIQRPTVDDPFQSARIYPFFAAIGRGMIGLKDVPGITDRLKEMLNKQKNQPDSSLFELAVANLYLRNGWSVSFLKEKKFVKTPDFEINRGDQTFFVECKRLAKIPDSAENERRGWQKRFHHLASAMKAYGISVHAEVNFDIPISEVPEYALGQLFTYYCVTGWIKTGKTFSINSINFSVKVLDLVEINKTLKHQGPRLNSPSLIKVITGDYEMHGNYTQLFDFAHVEEVGLNDGLHVLNKFCYGIHAVYSAKYKCHAKSSIEMKAKDVKKVLKKATEQFPSEKPGIIHIGYETVMGPEVETMRYEKTKVTVNNFDFKDINIEAVYCHAIQPLIKIEEFECAETTLYFEKNPRTILNDELLLNPPGLESVQSTHWDQDLEV